MNLRRTFAISASAVVMVLGLTACNDTPASVSHDQEQSNTQLETYQRVQPVPLFNWSQYRQTTIDIEAAQANGVATTTFFYNMGSNTPIKSCPPIGFPVASTSQITNPSQVVWGSNSASGVVSQLEPNGVYTGDSTGTYVVCVTPSGAKEITYWEGYVETEGGAAHFDSRSGQIVLDGEPTVVSKSKPGNLPSSPAPTASSK